MNSNRSIVRALIRRDIKAVYSILTERARVRARQRNWPAIEDVKGDFCQGVGNIPDMQAFYAQADPMVDTPKGIPELVHGRCYVCQRDVDSNVFLVGWL